MTNRRLISWMMSAAIAGGMTVAAIVPTFGDGPATHPSVTITGENVTITSAPSTQATAEATPATQPAPQEMPATQPSTSAETPKVTPEARQILEQTKAAYAALKSLDITGTVDAKFDVDGEKQNQHGELKGSYQSGGKFRSDVKDDAIAGNNGEKLFIFLPAKNAYVFYDLPKAKLDLDSVGNELGAIIRQQDMSLALALSADAGAEISDGASSVSRTDDVKIDDVAYPALMVSQKAADITLLFDPQSHLLRRQTMDLSKMVRAKGAQNIKAATVVVDFKNVPDAPVTDQQFAWTPPAGAQEMHPPKDPAAMVGSAAPAFELEGLDGNKIASASLKGSVYILDFWATWCGPCVHSLPELDKIYQANKAAGLKVYAVNQQEDKDTVAKFVKDKGLTIPVLLDTEGKAGEAYGANAIPETVLVGKDGIIRKVFVGSGHDEEISKEVESALKGNSK